MKRNRLTIAIAAVLILVFGSLLFIFQVPQSKVAVVTTFGTMGEPISKPGAYFQWPWPIQQVFLLDQRIQDFEGTYEETKLPDQNILMMQVYVGWKIDDPKAFFPCFPKGKVEEAEKALSVLAQSAKNEVASQHAFSDFISANEKEMKYDQIEREILEKIQKQVKDKHYGIEIKFVQIKKLGLPESVTQNVFERMKSERQITISRIQSEGEAEAARIRSKADSDAAIMLADADAAAFDIRGKGQADAQKALSVLQQNPELANFNLKLEALESMLKEKTTLILDQGTPPLDLLQAANAPKAAEQPNKQ